MEGEIGGKPMIKWAIIILCLTSLFTFPMTSQCVGNETKMANLRPPSSLGVIRSKNERWVILKTGQSYAISPFTRFYMRGHYVKIGDLPVPCEAEIEYVMDERLGKRVATLIKIKKVLKGAITRLQRPFPQ